MPELVSRPVIPFVHAHSLLSSNIAWCFHADMAISGIDNLFGDHLEQSGFLGARYLPCLHLLDHMELKSSSHHPGRLHLLTSDCKIRRHWSVLVFLGSRKKVKIFQANFCLQIFAYKFSRKSQ